MFRVLLRLGDVFRKYWTLYIVEEKMSVLLQLRAPNRVEVYFSIRVTSNFEIGFIRPSSISITENGGEVKFYGIEFLFRGIEFLFRGTKIPGPNF